MADKNLKVSIKPLKKGEDKPLIVQNDIPRLRSRGGDDSETEGKKIKDKKMESFSEKAGDYKDKKSDLSRKNKYSDSSPSDFQLTRKGCPTSSEYGKDKIKKIVQNNVPVSLRSKSLGGETEENEKHKIKKIDQEDIKSSGKRKKHRHLESEDESEAFGKDFRKSKDSKGSWEDVRSPKLSSKNKGKVNQNTEQDKSKNSESMKINPVVKSSGGKRKIQKDLSLDEELEVVAKVKKEMDSHQWPIKVKPVSFKPVKQTAKKTPLEADTESNIFKKIDHNAVIAAIHAKFKHLPKCSVRLERHQWSRNYVQIVLSQNISKSAGKVKTSATKWKAVSTKSTAKSKPTAKLEPAPASAKSKPAAKLEPAPASAKSKSMAKLKPTPASKANDPEHLSSSLEPEMVEILPCMNEFWESQLRIMYMGRPDENMDWLAVVGVSKESKNFCQCCFCPFLASNPKDVANHMVDEHSELGFALNKMRQPSGPLLMIHCRHCDFVSADPTIVWIHFEVHHGLPGIIDNASPIDVDLETPVTLFEIGLDEMVNILTSYVCFDCSLISDDVEKLSLHILQKHPDTLNYNGCFIKLLMIQKADGIVTATYRQVINEVEYATSRKEMFHCMICHYSAFCPFLALSHNLMTHQSKKLIYVCSVKTCSYRCLTDDVMLNHLTDKHDLSKPIRLVCSATIIDKMPSDSYDECDALTNRKTAMLTKRPSRKSSTRAELNQISDEDKGSSDDSDYEEKVAKKSKKTTAKRGRPGRSSRGGKAAVVDAKTSVELAQCTSIMSSDVGTKVEDSEAPKLKLVIESADGQDVVVEENTDSTDMEVQSQKDDTDACVTVMEQDDDNATEDVDHKNKKSIETWVLNEAGTLDKITITNTDLDELEDASQDAYDCAKKKKVPTATLR